MGRRAWSVRPKFVFFPAALDDPTPANRPIAGGRESAGPRLSSPHEGRGLLTIDAALTMALSPTTNARPCRPRRVADAAAAAASIHETAVVRSMTRGGGPDPAPSTWTGAQRIYLVGRPRGSGQGPGDRHGGGGPLAASRVHASIHRHVHRATSGRGSHEWTRHLVK